MGDPTVEGSWEALIEEMRNFQEIARFLDPDPGTIPRVTGVDVAAVSMPLNGVVGGDHIVYLDFARRFDLRARIEKAEAAGRTAVAEALRDCARRAGILLADVSGHRLTDALLVAMLHQAFLLGVYYELDLYGHISTRIFEIINARFHESTTVRKYLTMIYGEISDTGNFRFISAGHPPPVVFSAEFGRIMKISPERTVSYPPIGILRSGDDLSPRDLSLFDYKKKYTVNEINLLSPGDVLVLHTDGLSEHAAGAFFPRELEACLAESRGLSAVDTAERIKARVLASGRPDDDVAFVVIRKA